MISIGGSRSEVTTALLSPLGFACPIQPVVILLQSSSTTDTRLASADSPRLTSVPDRVKHIFQTWWRRTLRFYGRSESMRSRKGKEKQEGWAKRGCSFHAATSIIIPLAKPSVGLWVGGFGFCCSYVIVCFLRYCFMGGFYEIGGGFQGNHTRQWKRKEKRLNLTTAIRGKIQVDRSTRMAAEQECTTGFRQNVVGRISPPLHTLPPWRKESDGSHSAKL
ncbi:uncharacterized protein BJ171DRAFT_193542 [Polychytrium aggregatum]|uniref:uncharacterized protein n=1 Tax=Polychytrium aggregatum TaxID=110093 RepID=UPI0022FE58DD|nr:uncharacterized protein BJ171DRAFT_193542 [Polychytrium aggregatum]KAI9201965.1 hypothetical protein BJ171DRAFT_193542 [Polychytrium aggregatum]